jgi:hypothetical protein
MKTLTKEERHEIYNSVLSDILEGGWMNRGFCYHLHYNSGEEINGYRLDKYFPEIWNRRPENGNFLWSYFFITFEGKDPTREKILREAIEETKP